MAQSWEPTALDMYKAMQVAQRDHIPYRCDAVLIHGAPSTDKMFNNTLLRTVAEHHKNGCVGTIVLNGLSEEECRSRNLSYFGFEPWWKILREHDVCARNIVRMPASPHTGVESRNFLELAAQKGWESLIISSFPHHQLRCFQTIVAQMHTMGRRHVYNLTFGGINLTYPMSKPVMSGKTVLGSGDINGAFEIHMEEEFKRIVAYAQEPETVDGKPKFTRHATIPEVLEYVRWRDIQTV